MAVAGGHSVPLRAQAALLARRGPRRWGEHVAASRRATLWRLRGSRELCEHARHRAGSDSAMRCSPAWRATAASMMPATWPRFSPEELGAARRPSLSPRSRSRSSGPLRRRRDRGRPARRLCRDAYAGSATRPWRRWSRPGRTPSSSSCSTAPTLAFKDVAMQFRGAADGPCADRARPPRRPSSAPPRATPAARRSRPSAAASSTDIFILFPKGAASRRCSSGAG